MQNDPRLANVDLLALAAMRLKHRQASGALPAAWEHTEGLAALLTSQRDQEERNGWSPSRRPSDSMARLLAEARAWARAGEVDHGA